MAVMNPLVKPGGWAKVRSIPSVEMKRRPVHSAVSMRIWIWIRSAA